MSELRLKSTGTIKLFENDNTSSVTIASPASLGGDRTITLPDASVTLASGTMNDATNLSGNIPVSNLNSGTSAGATTFWRGDATWVTPTDTATQLKHINATRDMTTASGTQAITGVGFTPNAVVVNAMVEASNGASWGTQAYDQQGATADYSQGGAINWTSGGTSYCINLVTTGGSTNQKGHITSWDADGATITWLKAGSPTGTAHIRMLFIA